MQTIAPRGNHRRYGAADAIQSDTTVSHRPVDRRAKSCPAPSTTRQCPRRMSRRRRDREVDRYVVVVATVDDSTGASTRTAVRVERLSIEAEAHERPHRAKRASPRARSRVPRRELPHERGAMRHVARDGRPPRAASGHQRVEAVREDDGARRRPFGGEAKSQDAAQRVADHDRRRRQACDDSGQRVDRRARQVGRHHPAEPAEAVADAVPVRSAPTQTVQAEDRLLGHAADGTTRAHSDTVRVVPARRTCHERRADRDESGQTRHRRRANRQIGCQAANLRLRGRRRRPIARITLRARACTNGSRRRDSPERGVWAPRTTVDLLHMVESSLEGWDSARLRALVMNVPGAIYRCSPSHDWAMEFISDEVESISGHPASEYVNNHVRTYASVIVEQDRTAVEVAVGAALEPRRAVRGRVPDHPLATGRPAGCTSAARASSGPTATSRSWTA